MDEQKDKAPTPAQADAQAPAPAQEAPAAAEARAAQAAPTGQKQGRDRERGRDRGKNRGKNRGEGRNENRNEGRPDGQPAPYTPDPDDDNIATAEDIEAFMREHSKKRQEKKPLPERENPEVEEYMAEESKFDPYLDPDPSIPWVKYEEPLFLTRGCRRCPKSYVPVSNCERRSCSKVTSTNWLAGIRQPSDRPFGIVEVRFKNNHKDFYRLPDGLEVTEGDVVAVEGQPGHDVGIVSLTGELCRLQMRKHKLDPESEEIKKVFRRAKESDIDRWQEALHDELGALLRTRRIVSDLGLDMKINDVEFQGDHSKAIFYYTADERVDFRELIKLLADEFHVRIEMKQIGVRQEAGKVGGLGTCGRELCCSTWLTNFKSVSTSAAKTQQIMPNPQKLAGQCGKLKCCLNFEYEVYADALKKFPPTGQAIRSQKGLALYKKIDVFRGIMWYAYEGESDLMAIPAERVKEIIEMNRRQEYPEKFEDYQVELMSTSALSQESTDEEVEREMLRLSEGGNGVVGEGAKGNGQRGQRRQERDGDRRGNRPDREGRDNREGRGPRPDRQGKQPRQPKAPQGAQGGSAPTGTAQSADRPEGRRNGDAPRQQHNNKPRREGGGQRRDDEPRRSGNQGGRRG